VYVWGSQNAIRTISDVSIVLVSSVVIRLIISFWGLPKPTNWKLVILS